MFANRTRISARLRKSQTNHKRVCGPENNYNIYTHETAATTVGAVSNIVMVARGLNIIIYIIIVNTKSGRQAAMVYY